MPLMNVWFIPEIVEQRTMVYWLDCSRLDMVITNVRPCDTMSYRPRLHVWEQLCFYCHWKWWMGFCRLQQDYACDIPVSQMIGNRPGVWHANVLSVMLSLPFVFRINVLNGTRINTEFS